MNTRIKDIATETFATVNSSSSGKNAEQIIDAFVIAYTRAILFEATDVIREKAREHPQEVGMVLKATAIDVLDHFGLWLYYGWY